VAEVPIDGGGPERQADDTEDAEHRDHPEAGAEEASEVVEWDQFPLLTRRLGA
jgi:hypothetical protein